MSGGFGIGLRVPGGCYHVINGWNNNEPSCYYNDNFHDHVDDLIAQVQSIGNVGWLIVGITSGADGQGYLTWHSVLNEILPLSAPPPPSQGGKDSFHALAVACKNAGIRLIAYVATEGPAKLKHGVAKAYDGVNGTSASMNTWMDYVESKYGVPVDRADRYDPTLMRGFADIIIKEFAFRYRDLIDGWWFDHAIFGNRQLLAEHIRAANPNAVIAFNFGQKVPLINNNGDLEDYTYGHPTPIARVPASAVNNTGMVTSVEASDNGYFYKDGHPSLGHLFMPVSDSWNALSSTESVWSQEQARDWMSRVLNSGGAWTWNSEFAGLMYLLFFV